MVKIVDINKIGMVINDDSFNQWMIQEIGKKFEIKNVVKTQFQVNEKNIPDIQKLVKLIKHEYAVKAIKAKLEAKKNQ